MAENGLQAVAAVKEKDYGLVLMDVAMPEMDGLEATRTIRALAGERARVPIVAMTAGAFPEDKQRCLDVGMNDHLSKPVVRADLLSAVDRWLTGSAPRTRPAGEQDPAQVLLDEAVLAELEEEVTAELFPAMVDAFVAEVQRRLPIIGRAAGERDMGSVGGEAHALKGVAGTFGATALQARALELERAAKEDRADLVVDRVPALMTVAKDTLAAMAHRFGGGDRDLGAPSTS
jgi:CheY-like chemotaxis protein/HPt (histidine-containing phosphotransfer) domain-containing protein